MIAANRVGTDDSLTFCGSGRIIDPFGQSKAGADEVTEELIYADIDVERVNAIRVAMPVLDQDQSSDERDMLYYSLQCLALRITEDYRCQISPRYSATTRSRRR